VALQLAENGGNGIRSEGDPDPGVVSVDGLDQADEGHLIEVLHRLAPAGEAARQTTGQPSVQANKIVTQPVISGREIATLHVDDFGGRAPIGPSGARKREHRDRRCRLDPAVSRVVPIHRQFPPPRVGTFCMSCAACSRLRRRSSMTVSTARRADQSGKFGS
jgi:hypothetical protein